MSILDFLWNHWLLLAFVAPALWAITNLIDVYFVDDIYEDSSDGFIISSLFQIVAWPFVFLFAPEFSWPGMSAAILSILGGCVFMLSFHFYFKALFSHNDVALLQVLWTLSLPLVPILAWIFLGERLMAVQYMGIVIAFVGAALLSYGGEIHREAFWKMGCIMAGAIAALAASMVIQKHAFDISPDDAFWGIYLLFSLGAILPGMVVWMRSRNPRILSLCRKYWIVFFFAETFALLGYLTSERTISLAPSASFVAVVESLVPVFVMLFSFMIVGVVYLIGVWGKDTQNLYAEQIERFWLKVLATIVIAAGIYLIT